MTEDDEKYLDNFIQWLRTLGDDVENLSTLLENESLPNAAREMIAGGLNYLLKSLDLIPDGIDEIGYTDDTFVIRVASYLASKRGEDIMDSDFLKTVGPFTNDCDLIRDFLDADFERFESYVANLKRGAVRGRTATDIVENDSIRADFIADIRAFARNYEIPNTTRAEKNLIKLRAFFDAKLPT